MSIELFDLASRLRAATTGRPLPRSTYAPALPPTDAIAVTATGTHDALLVHAATDTDEATGFGEGALAALSALGVTPSGTHRTLVVPDRRTLTVLTAAARQAPDQTTAAVVGWWQQRAEHPGTGAVICLPDACRQRWTLGTAPTAERHLSTWRTWLGISEDGPHTLLTLARLVTDGHTLPGLLAAHEADSRSWAYHCQRVAAGWDWRTPDNRSEAALGLTTRTHAAELYDSLRLGDPLVAERESWTGTVITGTVIATPERGVVHVQAQGLLCRLRADTAIQGWAGRPVDIPGPTGTTTRISSGRLAEVTMTPDHRLILTLVDAVIRPGRLQIGDTVTLRPRTVDPRQQSNGRALMRDRYRTTRNWLAGGTAPAVRRREVPLDVVVSAAE